mmetsp:Transcript_78228/g.253356  ORF Transcript_78228/g.253356 Transcript_78228/m.253356 type:complete len:256 (+) Transcript_78228:222-989(+)
MSEATCLCAAAPVLGGHSAATWPKEEPLLEGAGCSAAMGLGGMPPLAVSWLAAGAEPEAGDLLPLGWQLVASGPGAVGLPLEGHTSAVMQREAAVLLLAGQAAGEKGLDAEVLAESGHSGAAAEPKEAPWLAEGQASAATWLVVLAPALGGQGSVEGQPSAVLLLEGHGSVAEAAVGAVMPAAGGQLSEMPEPETAALPEGQPNALLSCGQLGACMGPEVGRPPLAGQVLSAAAAPEAAALSPPIRSSPELLGAG